MHSEQANRSPSSTRSRVAQVDRRVSCLCLHYFHTNLRPPPSGGSYPRCLKKPIPFDSGSSSNSNAQRLALRANSSRMEIGRKTRSIARSTFVRVKPVLRVASEVFRAHGTRLRGFSASAAPHSMRVSDRLGTCAPAPRPARSCSRRALRREPHKGRLEAPMSAGRSSLRASAFVDFCLGIVSGM